MDAQEIQDAFDEAYDHGVMWHGYAPYMRDYDVYVVLSSDPRLDRPLDRRRYRFTHCVRATATSTVSPEVWSRSLDERLVDYAVWEAAHDAGEKIDGYVWGVNEQVLYPGMSLMDASVLARRWSDEVGITFHEARIEMNAHAVTLVFADLRVDDVEPGFSPFTVT